MDDGRFRDDAIGFRFSDAGSPTASVGRRRTLQPPSLPNEVLQAATTSSPSGSDIDAVPPDDEFEHSPGPPRLRPELIPLSAQPLSGGGSACPSTTAEPPDDEDQHVVPPAFGSRCESGAGSAEAESLERLASFALEMELGKDGEGGGDSSSSRAASVGGGSSSSFSPRHAASPHGAEKSSRRNASPSPSLGCGLAAATAACRSTSEPPRPSRGGSSKKTSSTLALEGRRPPPNGRGGLAATCASKMDASVQTGGASVGPKKRTLKYYPPPAGSTDRIPVDVIDHEGEVLIIRREPAISARSPAPLLVASSMVCR